MTLLRRPGPRFVLWAALLVGVAAAAYFADFSAWVIIALEFVAWVIVAASERKLSGSWTTGAVAAQMTLAGDEAADLLLANVPSPNEYFIEPDPIAYAEPEAPALPEVVPPVRRRRTASPTPSQASARATQWNVWALEEVVRDNAPDNDELVYLTVSLRDFADANGLLPVGFDPLVRESFGSLLQTPG